MIWCSEIAVMDMGSIKTVKETKALFADPGEHLRRRRR